MAKVKKFGEAVVITSAAKLEDIRKVAKYRPAALQLIEDEEPVFCIGLSDSRSGSISKYGIEFGGSSPEGYAQVTTVYAGPDENVEDVLADTVGPQLRMLSKLEESFPAVISEINGEIAAIKACIEVG